MVNFVICEFNPFHNGHKYLLKTIHDRPTVCIMSGHITQRGAFAFTDKWTRAAAALTSGADLVLELPESAAAGSAMDFARGAVKVAEATGFDGRLCFGTEGNVIKKLHALAALPEQTVAENIKPYLKKGLSPAAALMELYRCYLPDAAEILKSPNNLLAFEYIKANTKFSVLSVERQGCAHDSAEPGHMFASASYLREHPKELPRFVPEKALPLYHTALQNGHYLDNKRANVIITACLRDMPRESWEQLYPGGLGARLFSAFSEQTDLMQIIDSVKSKCFTHSAIRRAVLNAYLGGFRDKSLCYLRVLGMNETGRALLADMRPALPVLIKPAKITELGKNAMAQFLRSAMITDRFTYLWHTPQKKGLEYRSPVVL